MSGSESHHDATPFAHPPAAEVGSGAIDAGPGLDVRVPRAMEAIALGIAVAAWIFALGWVPPRYGGIAHASTIAVVASIWYLAAQSRTPRRRIFWDPWGVTEEVRGARVAIAWTSARASVGRAGRSTIVRIVDEAGRSIVCACGRDLPRWAAASVAHPDDVERLVTAVVPLPRADAPAASSPLGQWAIPVSAFAAILSAVVIQYGTRGGGGNRLFEVVAAGLLLLLLAIAPDLPRLAALASRAWAMRGAETIRLARGRMAIAGARGEVPLVVHEAFADARIAERDEPVRAVLVERGDGDGYRASARASARRLESVRERLARWSEGAQIALRATLIAGAGALLVLAIDALSRVTHRHGEMPPMPSLTQPRPPTPTAWRAPPRAPIVHRAVRATCNEDGTDCHPAITYFDEVGREVFRCRTWSRERCDHDLREAIPDVEIEGE